jgi:hypothetical protein
MTLLTYPLEEGEGGVFSNKHSLARISIIAGSTCVVSW